jgi:predicted CoA-binding protein
MSIEADILRRTRTIAVVGASRDRMKEAHAIPARMVQAGYRVIPVNPNAVGETLFGEPVRWSLSDIDEPVDLVNVFRPAADAPDVVREAIAIGATAVWLQQGIRSREARALADDAGIDYVEDECIAVARARYAVTV